MVKTKSLKGAFLAGLLVVISFWAGFSLNSYWQEKNSSSNSHRPPPPSPTPLPLLVYSLPALKATPTTADTITLEKIITTGQTSLSVLFSYQVMGKKISGLANFPTTAPAWGGILMLRGWAPVQNYQSGTGTKNAGLFLAQNGLLTFAPDFLGYGQSDPPPADVLQARFEKPLQVKQLLTNLQQGKIVCHSEVAGSELPLLEQICNQNKLPTLPWGMWAHSNGGQIALSTLEITQDAYPTTLWAPVSVGFPYSVLFFTDEEADEGKNSRAFIAQFESKYNSDDFSHSRHLDWLPPGLKLQLHHGSGDEAALISWSDEFQQKITQENAHRAKAAQIELTYYRYPGANHNLQPHWQQVVERDVDFFRQHLEGEK